MKIHEYQAKALMARCGIPVPRGVLCRSPGEVEAAAEQIMRESGLGSVVVKAQIHAGGRGKGGGVKVATGATQAGQIAARMLGQPLVTHQTGPDGQIVRLVYVEQALEIVRELYLAVVVDRDARRIAMMASTEGGMDIETVARQSPEKIHTVHVDPIIGLASFQIRRIASALGLDKDLGARLAPLARSLYDLLLQQDCSLCEINPLCVTAKREMVALDAKIGLDDNASFRHPDWDALRDRSEEDPVESEAKEAGLSYVSLDGEIGCLVNGAGLAMSTMDIVKSYGGRPANFLDVGGGATEQQVAKAFTIILRSPKVKGILVNIFGGIMKCDLIASGIVAATRQMGLGVPLVVRLEGTNVEQGRTLLAESGLRIQSASSMADAAQRIVAAVAGA
jgi:succinyl-CoA synthetase beta subunit